MTTSPTRPCEPFLQLRGSLLGDYGYCADPGQVERTANGEIVAYHYTRPDRLDTVLEQGLRARLPVVSADGLPELEGRYLVEAFLDPLPLWITNSPYFGDLGSELMHAYVGTVLLKIVLPGGTIGVYVADAAHNFELKHVNRRGTPALNLCYDCSNGREVCRAEALSYIPIQDYRGGHVAPNVKITRMGPGIAVPPEYIRVCAIQPLQV